MTEHAKRSLKIEKLARIYDDEIAPVWGARFGRLLLRNLTLPARGQVLDVSCGTGSPTIEFLRRMSEGSRLIAIDPSSAMLDVARRKVADHGLGKKGVFFRTESALPKLSFADEVYDLVVCNLGLAEMPSLEVALRDFARVTKRGGEVRCTLPLAGSFEEFHDLYREVLLKHDKHEALERLERYLARAPTAPLLEEAMHAAELDGGVEVEAFTLLFKSSREFFFAPVIEYGPLADWKEIAGEGQEMQDVFWHIKEAIDAYFEGRPFQVTVKAGCLIGTRREAAGPPARPAHDTGPLSLQDTSPFGRPERPAAGAPEAALAPQVASLPEPPVRLPAGSVRLSEADELEADDLDEVEELSEADLAPLDPSRVSRVSRVSRIGRVGGGAGAPAELAEPGAAAAAPAEAGDDPGIDFPSGDYTYDESAPSEHERDALLAGRKRPRHLGD